MIEVTIDTREQTPWSFDEHLVKARIGTVKTGDYCITGDNGFAIERKSFDDFLGTISKGWSRFQREIYRAQERGFTLPILVEGRLQDLLFHYQRVCADCATQWILNANARCETNYSESELLGYVKAFYNGDYEIIEKVVPPAHDHFKLTPSFVLKRIGELQHLGACVSFCERAEYARAIAYSMLHERWVMLRKDDENDLYGKTSLRED